MPKVSVVVPVYNVETYLGECLDSLCAQSLKDIEIICVNDGSKDGSLRILREYAAKDARIKVIDKQNAGVSAARNDGMAAASGEYVTFADGDDWLEPTAYAKIMSSLGDERPDMVIFGYYESVDGKNEESVLNRLLQRYETGEDIPLDMQILRLGNTVWNHFYRLDFVRKNALAFPEGVAIAEDGLFNIQCFLKKPSVRTLSGAYYFYRRFREGSTLTASVSLEKVLEQKRYCDKSAFYQRLEDDVRMLVDLKIAGSLAFRNRLLADGQKAGERRYLKDYDKYLNKKYDKEKLKAYAEYRSLLKEMNGRSFPKKTGAFLKSVFSVRNSEDKRHKVITVLGLKIKVAHRRKSTVSL